MNNTNNEKQKKLLLVLPLLAIPFATMFFWALGGGKATQAQANTSQLKGLNMQLPGAHLKNDSAENKLSFYEQAEKDSAKYIEARKDDPYYKADTTIGSKRDTVHLHDTGIIPKGYTNIGANGFSGHSITNSRLMLAADEQQINEKLATLNKQVNQPALTQPSQNSTGNSLSDTEIDQLQARLQKMSSSNAPDPQMQQLSSMLDKIQEIQNPGLVQQKLKEQSLKNRGQVFAVSSEKKENTLSTLENGSLGGLGVDSQQNGFYSYNDNVPVADQQNAIEAVIHETQTLVAGSTVKLRLVNDVYINGALIPKDVFVFGIASLNGERLSIKISTIRYRNSIFPVDLAVFDMDGADGIYIPGAITRDVAKESADQGVQNLDFTTYDPSVGAQAASAGISAAKSLFSRKVKLVKVTVKAGYQVLLRDEKQKQNN